MKTKATNTLADKETHATTTVTLTRPVGGDVVHASVPDVKGTLPAFTTTGINKANS